MDELEVFKLLDEHGVVLIETDKGLVLGIKREVLEKVVDAANADADDVVFIMVDGDDSPDQELQAPPKTILN